ncbi:hypothetical protein ACSVDA_24555 [Cytobacillus sp. Hm23]
MIIKKKTVGLIFIFFLILITIVRLFISDMLGYNASFRISNIYRITMPTTLLLQTLQV